MGVERRAGLSHAPATVGAADAACLRRHARAAVERTPAAVGDATALSPDGRARAPRAAALVGHTAAAAGVGRRASTAVEHSPAAV